MSFRVTCPECDAVHKVDDKNAGRTVVCGECQCRFRATRDEDEVERRPSRPPVVRTASASGSRKPTASRTTSKKKSGPHWAYVAGGSVAGSLILCLVGWNLFLKPAAQPYTHPEIPPFTTVANVAPNDASRTPGPGGIPPAVASKLPGAKGQWPDWRPSTKRKWQRAEQCSCRESAVVVLSPQRRQPPGCPEEDNH